jgi:peptide/nickel transport system substrate-binding protein
MMDSLHRVLVRDAPVCWGLAIDGAQLRDAIPLFWVAVGAAFLLQGCRERPDRSVHQADNLRIALQYDPVNLDPIRAPYSLYVTQLYDPLFEVNANGSGVRPALAGWYRLSPDGLTLLIGLRDARFANGDKLQAQDVAWSLERLMHARGSPYRDLLHSVRSVTPVGHDRVLLKLRQPDAEILGALAYFPTSILPRRSIGKATTGGGQDSFFRAPFGTGPYRVTRWQSGVSVELTRNPHYWRQGGGGDRLPRIRDVTYTIVPDQALMVSRLRANEADIVMPLNYAAVPAIERSQALRVHNHPIAAYNAFIFNLRPERSGRPNPLADARVRLALEYGLDKVQLARLVTLSTEQEVQESYLPPTIRCYSDELPVRRRSSVKARKLLASAGFDGGVELEIDVPTGNGDLLSAAVVAQAQWAEIGVRLKIVQLENLAAQQRWMAGDFDLTMFTVASEIPDAGYLSGQLFGVGAGIARMTGTSQPALTELYARSRRTYDEAERCTIFKEMQRRVHSGALIIPVFRTSFRTGERAEIRGHAIRPTIFDVLYNVRRADWSDASSPR